MNHSEKAVSLFKNGYNCAQSVFGAFCDVTGFDLDDAMRFSSAFGGGMGRMREVCGACSAMFMVAGILYGYSECGDDEGKRSIYADVQSLAEKFRDKNNTIICRELLKDIEAGTSPDPTKRTEEFYKIRPCARFISDAAKILDEYIIKKESADE